MLIRIELFTQYQFAKMEPISNNYPKIPIYTPQQPNFNSYGVPMPLPMGQPVMSYPDTPMTALERLDAIWISQKPQYIESLTCCEYQNKYRVYGAKHSASGTKRDKRDKIFTCKEKSTFAQRCCIPFYKKSLDLLQLQI
eukprot:TRINITY_DN1114_c0_g1_i5.p4 TRINITY_DN1114_c0_g1~~TRINITY_DN1114_c0_g1_i5.p4  ORF type:complete len:139 (-),score=4.46 TRINITY_DN1114_c0_g1_i5:404-820(-)